MHALAYSQRFTKTPYCTDPNKTVMQTPKRILIFVADVKRIHNCSDSSAARKITQAKDAMGKQKHQPVTIEEYCSYYSLNLKTILEYLDLL